jgi:hypothetical protein
MAPVTILRSRAVMILFPIHDIPLDFTFVFEQIRGLCRQHALNEPPCRLDSKEVEAELARFISSVSLGELSCPRPHPWPDHRARSQVPIFFG